VLPAARAWRRVVAGRRRPHRPERAVGDRGAGAVPARRTGRAVSDEAKAALRKLVRALPQSFRADAEAAASATMIDPTRWGERDRRPSGDGGPVCRPP